MSKNDGRATDPDTGAKKGRKPRDYSLFPWDAVGQVAEVYDYGANEGEYDIWNWRKGYVWSWSFSALIRHLAQWQEGEDIDPDSGHSHLAHAAFHILTLLTFTKEHPEMDDRYSTIKDKGEK